MTATAERIEQLDSEFRKAANDVFDALTLRVNDLSEQNATLLQRVNAQSALVQELRELIEDLMAGSRIETTHQPEIRVRIGHTHTLKDGWRCDSTTVEWTGRGEVDWGSIRDELKNAHVAGDQEAMARHNEALAPT